MKKVFFATFALLTLLFTSCTNDDINISTTPKTRTLTYIVNTQSMYDELGITSEVTSNYLGKNCSVGIYTFIYDAEQNLVTTQSSKESSLGTSTETFKLGEGTYTVVTYETLVDNGYTPSWSGEDKLSTLTFNDNSSCDHHYVSGSVMTTVSLAGGDKTETVTPAATRVLMTLNINTKSMYDEFGVTDDLTNKYLRDSKAPIGLFTYIYNSQGDLVDSVKTQQYSLNNVTLTRSLAKGDYTILTIETLVDPNGMQPTFWRFDDIQKLATVKMKQIYSNPSKYEVVGVATTNVNLTISKEVSITNKAIGSIVSFIAYNFEKTTYAQIGFGTRDLLDYYILNPQLSRSEKFVKDLSDSEHFHLRGLKMTPEVSTEKYVSAYILENSIDWEFSVQRDAAGKWYAMDEGKANPEDGKTYYAGFYYLYSDNDKTYFSTYFGDLEGFKAWKSREDEIVDAQSSAIMFKEPYITWGGTVASVKSFMSGYRIGNDGQLVENNGEYILWYYGKYKEDETQYVFTSPTGGLSDVVLFFDADKVGEDDLSKALTEMEYEFILSGDGYSAYSTKDSKSYVLIQLNDQNNWILHYFSASANSRPKRIMEKGLPTFAPRQHKSVNSKHLNKVDIVTKLRQCEKAMKLYSK